MPKMDRTALLTLNISRPGFAQGLEAVKNMALTGRKGYCCFANVHMLIEAYQSPTFTEAVNNASFVFPDGKPLAYMVGKITGSHQERIAGMDFMPAILQLAAQAAIPVYFFGTTTQVLEAIMAKANTELPNLIIAGHYAPPFGDQTEAENNHYCNIINQSGAKLVFVALGCPRQEKWMFHNRGRINGVMLGVGGAFPIYAGKVKRSPVWMQNLGLEWLHRLLSDPKRLWKRYLFTNTLFILLIIPLLLRKPRQP
jgi:N-acetylglucosaminyldiphosphoundecaprenol N-acetyl-beta-D-mannosaminyltransferase